MKPYRPLWITLLVAAILSPVGLYLPERLQAGPAWGEWSAEQLHRMVGYLPDGMQRFRELWTAPLPAYAWPRTAAAPLAVRGFAYAMSALLGIAACSGVAYLLTRWLTRQNQ